MLIKKNETNALIKSYEFNKEDKEFKQYVNKGKRIIRVLQGCLKESLNGGFVIDTNAILTNNNNKLNKKRSNSNMISFSSSMPSIVMKKESNKVTHQCLFESLFNSKFKLKKRGIRHHMSNSTMNININDNSNTNMNRTAKKNKKLSIDSHIKRNKNKNIKIELSPSRRLLKAYDSKLTNAKSKISLISPMASTEDLFTKQKSYQSTQSIMLRSTYQKSK